MKDPDLDPAVDDLNMGYAHCTPCRLEWEVPEWMPVPIPECMPKDGICPSCGLFVADGRLEGVDPDTLCDMPCELAQDLVSIT